MRKVALLFLFCSVLNLLGSPIAATDSEFKSLKDAEEAVILWYEALISSIKSGVLSVNKEYAEGVLDKQIIRSSLGKEIRQSLKEEIYLIDTQTNGLSELLPLYRKLNEYLQISELALQSNNLQESEIALQKAKEISDKITEPLVEIRNNLNKIRPALKKSAQDRKEIFEKMRFELEN